MPTQQVFLDAQVRGYYVGTKSSIQALTGVPTGSIGYSTDTNETGSYNGSSWSWGQVVTGGNSHDHFEGDGATIAYSTLSGAPGSTGWLDQASPAWTRTGDHTFTIPGDYRTIYWKGVKVRYKDGGSYEYGTVGSVTYDGGTVTTTVNLIANTDYAMAATTITNMYVSYAENPEGWPMTFNYTPTFSRSGTAFTNPPTVNQAYFYTIGKKLIGFIDFTMPAAAGGTGEVYATVPVTITADRTDFGVEVAVTAKQCSAFAVASINKLNFYNDDPAVIATTNGYRYQMNFGYIF